MHFKSTFLKNFLTVGLWTFVSRIFGFCRDIMLAAFLGSGPIGEAFIIAFSLPNIFRRFFAEGAFNAAFIPMFKKNMDNKNQYVFVLKIPRVQQQNCHMCTNSEFHTDAFFSDCVVCLNHRGFIILGV